MCPFYRKYCVIKHSSSPSWLLTFKYIPYESVTESYVSHNMSPSEALAMNVVFNIFVNLLIRTNIIIIIINLI